MNDEYNQLYMAPVRKKKYSKSLSFVLFLTFLSLLFLYIRVDNPLRLYCLLFGFVLLLGVLSTQKLYVKINKIQKWWFIFISYTLIESIFSNIFFNVEKDGSAISSIYYLVIFMIILYFVQFCDRTYFFKIIRNFMAVCSVLGIIEYVTGFQFYKNWITVDNIERTYQIYGIPGTENYRLILFFGHPIFLSVFLTIFLIFLFYIPFNKKIINIFFELIGIICLILTQARSSWISLSIVLIFYIFVSKKISSIKIKYVVRFFVTVFLLGILIYIFNNINNPFFQNIGTIFKERINSILVSPETASGARMANLSLINYVSSSWIMILGGGNGYALSLLKAHPTVNGWTNAVDNQYLTFLINYGIIGLVIFIYFVILCIKTLYTTRDKINKMIILSIMSIIFAGYFFEFYQNMYVNYFLFILVAFIREDNYGYNSSVDKKFRSEQ